MDDDEIFEDTICIVDYTESQKSISTTHAYSPEHTDSSSGKESRCTYVLEVDSDPPPPPPPPPPAGASLHTYSLVSQETFTQTSKTLIELTQTNYTKESNAIATTAIETQTSQMSVVENKTVEYRIQVSGSQTRFSRYELVRGAGAASASASASGGWLLRADADADPAYDSDRCSSETLRIVDDGPADQLEPSDDTSKNADTSRYDTDFNDSLEDDYRANRDEARDDARDDSPKRSITNSVDRDVEELYDKLERSFDLRSLDRPDDFDILRYVTLTPLTEETAGKAESAPEPCRKQCIKTDRQEQPNQKNNTTSEPSIRKPRAEENQEQLKLPPIGRARAGSPPPRAGAGRWEPRGAALAAGEGAGILARTGKSASPHLPSIYMCGTSRSRGDASPARAPPDRPDPRAPADPRDQRDQRDTISIHNKIQQLKMPAPAKKRMLYSSTTTGSRSSSPGSTSGCGGGGGGGASAEATARGCEALCADMLARLRRHVSCVRPSCEPAGGARAEGSDQGAHWEEAVSVLEEIPVRFRGFWSAVPEHRVADLLRLVTALAESPRTRVALSACATLAAILANTNYTKKPDFCEAMTTLLVKTGSCVRPLRRAANVALDAVVARVDLTHSVTALCLFGVEHKSPCVRCAAARLLVVCAALARGGRGLLRARPASAAHARRHALRALSELLHDRNRDTRKYAERLYAMLRPLPGFEAFFLADVGARTACRQLAHYDALLAPAPPPAPPPAPAPPHHRTRP